MSNSSFSGSDQWYLEVNGKKFGPYSMAQIQGLLRHKEIVGEDRITSSHLEGQWISVQEFVRRTPTSDATPAPIPASPATSPPVAKATPTPAPALNPALEPSSTVKPVQLRKKDEPSHSVEPPTSAPAADHSIPPRPDERTLTSIMRPSAEIQAEAEARAGRSDAVHDLFEILQAARERKPTPQVHHTEDEESSSGFGSGDSWRPIAAIALGILVAFGAWKFASHSSKSQVEKNEVADTSRVQTVKTAPPSDVHMASSPAQTTAATHPASMTKSQVHTLPGFTVGHKVTPSHPNFLVERQREIEKQRERERQQQLEKQQELAREKERERERQQERERELARERAQERDPNQSDYDDARTPASSDGYGYDQDTSNPDSNDPYARQDPARRNARVPLSRRGNPPQAVPFDWRSGSAQPAAQPQDPNYRNDPNGQGSPSDPNAQYPSDQTYDY